jgi:hypothetical protein
MDRNFYFVHLFKTTVFAILIVSTKLPVIILLIPTGKCDRRHGKGYYQSSYSYLVNTNKKYLPRSLAVKGKLTLENSNLAILAINIFLDRNSDGISWSQFHNDFRWRQEYSVFVGYHEMTQPDSIAVSC